MPREKFKTLTEQMYYVLLALQEELCGVDIMEKVRILTDNRIRLGPGTIYALLGDFQREGFIRETETDGSRRCYMITEKGREILVKEYQRHRILIGDFERFYKG